MRDNKIIKNHTSRDSADLDPAQDTGELERQLQLLKNLLHTASERPDFFWKRQHSAIMARVNKPVPAMRARPALLWTPVALGLILCLFLFVRNSKAPPPDFAAGSDQELLIGIERALSREYPEAFDPAVVIVPGEKKE